MANGYSGEREDMPVIVKSSSGIQTIPMSTKLLSERKIFIRGEITPDVACEFMQKMIILNGESDEEPIDVFIDSPGGGVDAGLVMYDAIQESKAPVRMFCLGTAYSMGAFLFISGTHGRYMLRHAKLMLHEPLLGSGFGGSASSVKSVSDHLLETRDKLNELLAKHSGKTVEEIAKATDHDHYFTAEQSVDFGLCDEIVPFSFCLQK